MKKSIDGAKAFVLALVTEDKRWWWLLVMLVFVVHLVVVFPVLTPNLDAIGMYDESSYIERGRLVATNNLPAVDQSHITSFFYALTYVPVRESAFWLIHCCTIGRFTFFALLWFSLCMVAKQTEYLANRLIAIGFLVVSPVLTSLVANGNHALFTAISALALAQVISFYRTKDLSRLSAASLFVSLALLCRIGEGTFLLIALITLGGLLGGSFGRVRPALAAATLPAALVVGGYMLAYSSFTGQSPLGTGEYFYGTFEQGHALAFEDQFHDQSWTVGQAEGRR